MTTFLNCNLKLRWFCDGNVMGVYLFSGSTFEFSLQWLFYSMMYEGSKTEANHWRSKCSHFRVFWKIDRLPVVPEIIKRDCRSHFVTQLWSCCSLSPSSTSRWCFSRPLSPPPPRGDKAGTERGHHARKSSLNIARKGSQLPFWNWGRIPCDLVLRKVISTF